MTVRSASIPAVSAVDFELLEKPSTETSTVSAAPPRPTLFRALIRNPVTVFAATVVASVLLMTLLGPLFWSVDPARQNMAEISLPPIAKRSAQLVGYNRTWRGEHVPVSDSEFRPASELVAVTGLRTVQANTEGVRIAWQKIAGARTYHIFRHELEPSGPFDLGIPLGQVDAGQLYYEDRLGLQQKNYFYSVVAGDEREISKNSSMILVRPHPAISYWDAQLAGLIDENHQGIEGEVIELPAHPLGTDYLGRDIFARLMQGARTSLFIGLCAPFLFIGFGCVYGAVSGYLGGWVDHWMMRVVDFVIALPFLLFMILFKIMFGIGPGESGVLPMLIALVLLSWPDSARLVRGQVLQLREQAYVDAARLLGGSHAYIIRAHLLPNVASVLLVSFSFAIPAAIFTEAFLSFIGLGVVPPTPSWGSMCNDGIRTLLTHPHELLFPATMISLTVLSFNLLGDGLRDALDGRTSL